MTTSGARSGKRVHFIANGLYGNHFGGGDLHFFEMAKAAGQAGYEVNFFGGEAFKKHWEARKLPGSLTLTDKGILPTMDEEKLPGQLALLFDHFGRFWRTLQQLSTIREDEYVYATSDYWFDAIPAMLCKASRKIMVFHMEFPTLRQIILKSRADVSGTRLASLYNWLSQNLMLRCFRSRKNKRVLFLHAFMKPRLLKLGYKESELQDISYGVDISLARTVPEQKKVYDVVWIGRVHRQKGIDDLLQTLAYVADRVPEFRAILIGNLQAKLGSTIKELGITKQVEFSGFVSETEKYRLFKSSRVFVMPSLHEGSPRVIGEALACDLPVVAYNIVTYRPLFGELIRYVPCFDVQALQNEVERQVLQVRAGKNYLSKMNLDQFQEENSWETAHQKFCLTLQSMAVAKSV